MDHITSFQLPCNAQPLSTLFEVLPGEIRDRIYTHSLSYLDDKTRTWDKNSSWVRPGYDAPQKADTALLQTCQRVYSEAWFRPWLSTTHSFWLAAGGRRPDDKHRHTEATIQPALQHLFLLHGKLELDHVRVFAQLWALEPGQQLSKILNMDHFYPRVFTVTVRHHDWWFWESDELLSIKAGWVNHCKVPASVSQVRVELESLQRRKNQIDFMASEMTKKWQFRRMDDVVMAATAKDHETANWTGSSTWEGQRWIRDETKPDTNEYYIKTVVFKPNKEIPAKDRMHADDLRCPDGIFQRLSGSTTYLSTRQLEIAGVKPGMTADEAKKLVDSNEEAVNAGSGSDEEYEDEDEADDEDNENGSEDMGEDDEHDDDTPMADGFTDHPHNSVKPLPLTAADNGDHQPHVDTAESNIET